MSPIPEKARYLLKRAKTLVSTGFTTSKTSDGFLPFRTLPAPYLPPNGYAVTAVTHSVVLGVLAGVAAGAAFNLLFGFLAITRRSNQLASGLSLYFLGAGPSALIGASFIGQRIEGLRHLGFPGLSSLPDPWGRLFQHDILVWLVAPIAFLMWWVLSRTRWGLKLRATGEDRNSAYAGGVHPNRLQYQALGIAGALSGLGGVELALGYTKTWQEFMISGRGFIAIVIVIFSLWHPLRAIGGAFLFGAATALGLQLQAQGASISPHPWASTEVQAASSGRLCRLPASTAVHMNPQGVAPNLAPR